MTPTELAALHARCFTVPRPYGADEFETFLRARECFLLTVPGGFALGRVAADEAELLTLAVDPGHRRRGVARGLLAAFEAEARRRGARRAFLEVAASNAAAIGLYRGAGYDESGRRRGYYRRADGGAEDAVAMEKHPLFA